MLLVVLQRVSVEPGLHRFPNIFGNGGVDEPADGLAGHLAQLIRGRADSLGCPKSHLTLAMNKLVVGKADRGQARDGIDPVNIAEDFVGIGFVDGRGGLIVADGNDNTTAKKLGLAAVWWVHPVRGESVRPRFQSTPPKQCSR